MLVLAEVVRDEMEESLSLRAERLLSPEVDELIGHFRRLVKLTLIAKAGLRICWWAR